MADYDKTIHGILKRHGRSFAEELGIDVARNTPSPLFRLLCFCLLASARISHRIAMRAARALADAGWTTATHLDASTWRQRVRVLNGSGYARYDESTATMLGETVTHVLEAYGGDLRRLRSEADGDLDAARSRLKRFKGIGDAGADMFLREVQIAWDEFYPFMDRRSRQSARALGLPEEAAALARLVGDRRMFVRLVDGLVRESFRR
jgi:thermostable 8-oxoguanine DNA glycosylase